MGPVSKAERLAINRTVGIGIAVFIVVYFLATIFFIILE